MIYKDTEPLVSICTDEQAGKLFKALYAFACRGEELQADDPMLQGFFSVFRNAIVRADEKYAERCRKNAENGAKGGKAKAANASECQPMLANASERQQNLANLADRDRDRDRGSDRERESDRESERDGGTECGRGYGGNRTYTDEELMNAWMNKKRKIEDSSCSELSDSSEPTEIVPDYMGHEYSDDELSEIINRMN